MGVTLIVRFWHRQSRKPCPYRHRNRREWQILICPSTLPSTTLVAEVRRESFNENLPLHWPWKVHRLGVEALVASRLRRVISRSLNVSVVELPTTGVTTAWTDEKIAIRDKEPLSVMLHRWGCSLEYNLSDLAWRRGIC